MAFCGQEELSHSRSVAQTAEGKFTRMNGLDKTEKSCAVGQRHNFSYRDRGEGLQLAGVSWQREEETALIERTNQGRLSHRLTRINTDEGKERTL